MGTLPPGSTLGKEICRLLQIGGRVRRLMIDVQADARPVVYVERYLDEGESQSVAALVAAAGPMILDAD